MRPGISAMTTQTLMKKPNAFTRLELVAVVAGVALLGAVALPLLGSTRSEAEHATCLNNLRQVGRALQMWGADHGNQPPWRTPQSQDGLRPDAGLVPGNAWFDYYYMSNELVTPRILVCPADVGARAANNFSDYTAIEFRGNGTSYFINIHTASEFPRSALFGDRNVQASTTGTDCSLGNIRSTYAVNATNVRWTNAVHGLQGNLVLMDGSVSTTTSEELRQAFRLYEDENGFVSHVLKAR